MDLEVRNKLLSLKDEKYKEFQSKLCPNINNIIGVRLPIIKKLAKEYSKKDKIIDYIKTNNELYYEEIMIKGLLIGYIKVDKDIKFSLLKDFIPKIDNWAVCDSVVNNLKFIKNSKEETWTFLEEYLKSEEEFYVRFAVVTLMNYFLDEEYIDKVFICIDKIKVDKYYVKMSIAWLISVAYVKFKNKTLNYLKNNSLDNWIYNKALQKIIESYRVSKEEKNMIRNMKKAI